MDSQRRFAPSFSPLQAGEGGFLLEALLTVRRSDLWFAGVFLSFLFLYAGFILTLVIADALLPFRPIEEGGASAVALLWQEEESRKSLFNAFRLSLVTSLITACLGLLVGLPAAYGLSRYRFPLYSLIDTLVDIPIVVPPLIMGLTLLAVLRQTAIGTALDEKVGILYSPKGIVLAQFSVASAFSVRALKAAFDQVNPRFEQVARSLGASPFYAFFRVTLPLAKTGILAGFVMTWARAMGEFAPILVVAGTNPDTTVLPVLAFLSMSAGNIEIAFAVIIFMVIIASLALLVFKKLGGQGYIW
ncbi:MAG: ABC transporter permease [Armatimonadetes bacterium]|nr:ABC transporter permease [Armatimonadota bacterium]MDW8121383.1 ABC transporter permease [Armatimonadota bacterium]